MSGSRVGQAGTHSASCALPSDAVTFLWHDLRQSVAVIMASASAAAGDPTTSPDACRWLGHISEEAKRMSRICEHAIRAESAPRTLLALDDVVSGVIERIRVVLSTVIEFEPSQEVINVDGPTVERALANVLDNACKAAGPDGRVRIEIHRAPDDNVLITVDDNGPGFGAAREGRAGMGLDATRHVLGPLGGSLRISTRGPLGGARVELRVPFDSPQPTSNGVA